MPGRTCFAWLAALLATGLAPPASRAESALHLEYPSAFGLTSASTYDIEKNQVGDAHLLVEELDNGNVRMFSETGIRDGVRTVVMAELVPIDSGGALRPIRQESRSFQRDGRPMGVLAIDHLTREASCTKPKAEDSARIELPNDDRIVNVPLNLLFAPLVRHERKSVDFQIMLCRGGPRVVEFRARVTGERGGPDGNAPLVEISYGPKLGEFVSFFAPSLIPKLTFWFDPKAADSWLGHRLPLYAKGPEVLVVREGVSAGWLLGKP